jgi:hypothetical protein
MQRKCSHCHKEYTRQELAREETKGMEAERKALGLQGVLFRYYTCSACGRADIFVDVHRLPEETEDDFLRRRDELEAAINQVHGKGVAAVLVEKEPKSTGGKDDLPAE